MKPTTGRTVHYVSAGSADGVYPSVCRAAIVTAVLECGHGRESCVSLTVFNPEGLHFNMHVQYDNDRSPLQVRRQTWHWPEREPEENGL
jgi:hypothetical protein